MTNRSRRNTRPVPQTTQRRPARRPKKRKKVNWFRVTVVVLGLALVVLAAFGVVRASMPAVSAEEGEAVQEAEPMPEFFSTIRPASTPVPQDIAENAISVYASEFDGVLFVGDSLTARLEDYVETGAGGGTLLSDARFLTSSSYSWSDVADELNGGEGSLLLDDAYVTLTEALAQTGARKLYIQLGKEDLIYSDVNTVVTTAESVLSALAAENPSLRITVQSVTPMLQWIDYKGLSSRTIAEYNAAMKSYCVENGMAFADVAAFFTDGYLPAEYCADPGQLCIHLNDAGCALWTSYLLGEIEPEPEPTPEPEDSGADGTDADDSYAAGEA